jgi:hypothetical protein
VDLNHLEVAAGIRQNLDDGVANLREVTLGPSLFPSLVRRWRYDLPVSS